MRRICTSIGISTSGARPLAKQAHYCRFDRRCVAYLLYDPFIRRYKNDPRFAAFCKKAGLPTAAEAGKRI